MVEGWLCVPYEEALRREILDESHKTTYVVHPGATKMYHDVKKIFWWDDMKDNRICVPMFDLPIG